MNSTKDYRRLFTPPKVADRLVRIAKIEEGMRILEPAAGEGAIVSAIIRAFPYCMKGPNDKPGTTIDTCEINPEFSKVLYRLNTNETGNRISNVGYDFLDIASACYGYGVYDRVIMNPPFENDIWMEFVMKSATLLKPQGTITGIFPMHNIARDLPVHERFLEWLREINIDWIREADPLENWAKNNDGTITPLHIVTFIKTNG